MKHILAAATACLAAACASAANTHPTQLANACTIQPAYTDYAIGADVSGNAKSRRDANLQCGNGASPL